MVEHLSDRDLERLRRGGHDHLKIYAAYKAAVEHRGQPTVILVKTVKGWMLGESATGRNAVHQLKKLTEAELKRFRDLMNLPIPDAQVGDAPYYHPGEKVAGSRVPARMSSPAWRELPKRVVRSKPLVLPKEEPLCGIYRGYPAAGLNNHGHCASATQVARRQARSAGGLCRLFPTRHGPSEWTSSSRKLVSIPQRASSTTR
jgi:pyruvate dehydrogenase complex dehydrogenase (E1) component